MKTIKTLEESINKDFIKLNIRKTDLSEASEKWSWELFETPVLFKSSTVGDLDIMFSCHIKNVKNETISKDSSMISIVWENYLDDDEANLDGLLLSLKKELRKLISFEKIADEVAINCINDLFNKK